MNRVMCLAEDIDARIWYQDTDSMHIDYDSVQRLADAYRDLYSKELIGKQMGQFHSIQQFSPRSKRFPQFKIASNNPNEWQMDLALREKQLILISVKLNSRIGLAKLLNNKRAETVLKAIEDFVGETMFQLYFSIMAVSSSTNPLSRSLMSALLVMIIRFKKLTQSILNEAIANYNNTHHSAINATPSEMRGKVMLDDVEYKKRLVKKNNNDIPPGSIVRYRLKAKTPFDKEGARWSRTAYEVVGFDGLKIRISKKKQSYSFLISK
ncbi:unnamed protein product [Phytophthora fragariaefolia]|uniref:Unnamed protein product n=1 Tax=Phytophthora fragariaefolia TaxID=1490495 RepID=A0A9W7DA46_9STRA|nr:unnamed protein product [Phytophthora fragariaefolia]